MIAILALLFLFAGGLAQAELRFDFKESVTGQKAMANRSFVRQQAVFISGSKTAVFENNFLQISDSDQDQLIIIDHQTRRFAVGPLRGTLNYDRKSFLDQLPAGLSSTIVEDGAKDSLNGIPVERAVRNVRVPADPDGLPADAEVRITQFTATDQPGWSAILEKLQSPDTKYPKELAALISFMAVKDVQFKSRPTGKTLTLPVRTIAELRLTPQPSQDSEEVQALQNGILMRVEREISGLDPNPIDPSFFRAPADFQSIEMSDMLTVRRERTILSRATPQ
jgi:hypothetical protein